MATKNKTYALIYFRYKKPLKKSYDSCMRAFYDYEERGCVYVELYTEYGMRLCSYPEYQHGNIVADERCKNNKK